MYADREVITRLLKKFNFQYLERHNSVIVEHDFQLVTVFDFTDNDKVVITEKLKSYNMLTGIISMKLKTALLLNYIIFMVVILLLTVKMNENILVLNLICTLESISILFWTFYYLIKAENFKMLIMSMFINNKD